MNIGKRAQEILKLLNKAYGKPKPLRRTDPLDELIRTVLSQNTTDKNSTRAFHILKKNFKSSGNLPRVTRSQLKTKNILSYAAAISHPASQIKW